MWKAIVFYLYPGLYLGLEPRSNGFKTELWNAFLFAMSIAVAGLAVNDQVTSGDLRLNEISPTLSTIPRLCGTPQSNLCVRFE